jgi:ABC-type oligopeptide transport system ATPase subunit
MKAINTKIINLFGEPSCGKSTTSAGLFYLMKHKGFNVELVNEYAKQLVWSGRKETLEDQLYITAKQNHKLEMLVGKVDYAISDSPLLLGIIYSRKYMRIPTFHHFVKDLFDSYDNLNILLKRAKPYKEIGRIQTEKEAMGVRDSIIAMLSFYNVPYHGMNGDNEAPQKILDLLKV